MGEHQKLLERHRAVMPSWVALYYDEPISLVRGEGRHVWDAEGTRYMDWFGGILTTMTGYNVAEVVDAVREQAAKMMHTSTLYLIEPAIELAEKIAKLAPVDDARVFFTSSGTEANDAALMLATGMRRSNQVLAIRNSYHGRSFSAVPITGHRSWSPVGYSPFQVMWVQGPYRYRSPFRDLSDAAYTQACVDDLRDVLGGQSSGDVACMIAEPIQGVGGFTTPPDGFFRAMKEVLDEYDILFIADEVQTGWGRTGEHFWGIDAHAVRPDLMTFAKGLGNGLSIGGVVARREVMDSMGANSISTFGGNALTSAGALANLNFLLDNDCQRNALERGTTIFAKLRELAARTPAIGDVRGKGLMIGVEFVTPGSTTPDAAATARIMEECRQRGLLIGKGGLHGNVLRIAPALTLTSEEADEGLEILVDSINAVVGATVGAAS